MQGANAKRLLQVVHFKVESVVHTAVCWQFKQVSPGRKAPVPARVTGGETDITAAKGAQHQVSRTAGSAAHSNG